MAYLTHFWSRAWLPAANPPTLSARDPFGNDYLTYGWQHGHLTYGQSDDYLTYGQSDDYLTHNCRAD